MYMHVTEQYNACKLVVPDGSEQDDVPAALYTFSVSHRFLVAVQCKERQVECAQAMQEVELVSEQKPKQRLVCVAVAVWSRTNEHARPTREKWPKPAQSSSSSSLVVAMSRKLRPHYQPALESMAGPT